jgi:pyridoxine 5-phosphate synthase
MKPRLGVNIDHIATVREARGESYPSVVDAATICLESGADQITIHLREDRRHIQDADVPAVKSITDKYKKPLNLEMGCAEEIIDIAIAIKPDWVCLVPEKREEVTTEGGLNLLDENNFLKIKESISKIRAAHSSIKVSLFLEANIEILEKAHELEVNAVEIHTGDYAKKFLNCEDYQTEIEGFKIAFEFLKKNKIACHAGHGLTGKSVVPLLESNIFEEYNIGHWLISNSLFTGLQSSVKNLNKTFKEYIL